MAYLKNQNNEIIVDAILTKYGREKLARDGSLGVVKFAVSDDEVDYSLYNVNHPSGELYYDVAIRELPILEALPGSDAVMKFLLFTTRDVELNSSSTLYIADIPNVFSSGIQDIGIPFTVSPTLVPTPSDYQAIYYMAQVSGDIMDILTVNGNIDEKIGLTNDIVKARETVSNTQTESFFVGHSFTFKVKSLPRLDTTYSVKITANGPVSAMPYSFNIKVLGYNSLNG